MMFWCRQHGPLITSSVLTYLDGSRHPLSCLAEGSPKVTKDWAVAEYLGGCGDFTVSRYCGYTLTWVIPQLDWMTRSSVAVQLLQFAFNATFSHPQFAFYFTDMSPDNFAVSSDGKVRLVDLEHVIVVDKYPEDPPANWKVQHQSFHDESVNGFAFSTQEICSHQTSDMNIYSICQGILSEKSDLLDGGLLHSPPQHMLDITRMIRECVSPPTGKTRFDIAQSIIEVLDVR
ncbi:hypothetical protein J6590_068886 [Homalodisca vitripennis]|nr:hypothetical protein J6590_068886 [Homalodisca vitripennis]